MDFSRDQSRQGIPATLALVILALVVGGLSYMKAPTTYLSLLKAADSFVDSHGTFLAILIFAFGIDVIWVTSVIVRVSGLQKQGSRLQALTGRAKNRNAPSVRQVIASLSIGLALFAVLWLGQLPDRRVFEGMKFGIDATNETIFAIRLIFSSGAFVISYVLGGFSLWSKLRNLKGTSLPEVPRPKNGIVLGSVGEEDAKSGPSWAVMNRRALNGNILITASIGGGKTQGAILPYLDQALSNFELRPSILAIDPKGTFIPEALKIIERKGMMEHVLHMRLGGDVTFNPIFSPSPLSGAKFMDIAQMIRAASVNFMGKSFDSPFWEISAFNLIKNCLVLCGAKYCES